MLKILQARLQQYRNHELPDIEAGFRKGRGTRGQIANICWIIEKAREFQKNIYFCFIDHAKVFAQSLLTGPKKVQDLSVICQEVWAAHLPKIWPSWWLSGKDFILFIRLSDVDYFGDFVTALLHFMFPFFGSEACGILVPQPGMDPAFPHWKAKS